jgi:hypothetical protein
VARGLQRGSERTHWLHRFAVAELDLGRAATTIPVADCGPGEELQLDTGWMTLLEPDLFGKRRRFRARIFTAVRSRHRFAYVCFEETTHTAIAACEAAWGFFGGVFRVLIPDNNTKSIVLTADLLAPRITPARWSACAPRRGSLVLALEHALLLLEPPLLAVPLLGHRASAAARRRARSVSVSSDGPMPRLQSTTKSWRSHTNDATSRRSSAPCAPRRSDASMGRSWQSAQ